MGAALLLAGVSCDVEQESFKAQDLVSIVLLDQDQTSAKFRFESKTVRELAYLLVEESEKPGAVSATMIFHEGVAVDAGEDIQLSFLQPRTEYCLFVAGKSGARYLEGVLTKNFSTTDTDEDFSLLETDYFGFTLDMKLPAATKERGNVIRYKFNSLYNYNYFVRSQNYNEAYLLEWNTGLLFGDDEDGLTLEINQDTEYLRDEDNNLVLDELTGLEVQVHQPIAPGEPVVFLLGEFSKTGQLDHKDDWRTPLYNGQTGEWTGIFDRIFITSKAPEELDGEVDIDEISVGSVDAEIRLTPSENVEQYTVWIVEDEDYRTVHLPLLDDKEEYVQWFVTSYDAAYLAKCTMHVTDMTPAIVTLKKHGYDSPEPETDYHIFVVAGNEDYTQQTMTTHTITTRKKSGRIPEVVVTALDEAPEGEEDSPFEVWFNVKCTTGDAVSGMYAANYIGPWIQEYNDAGSHADLVNMGYSWSDEEIAQINSAEGYNISISTLEGMTTRLGVILYNDEDTPNKIDEDSRAMADAKSGYLDPAEAVDEAYFTPLIGDWILTGKAVDYNWGSSAWSTTPTTVRTKVRISAGVEYPETLSEDVYQVYADKEDILGITRDEVTSQYTNFKEEAYAWNARLRGQNRLLCFGFNSAYGDSRDLNAYDAFCDFDYVSYDNVAILHDFGPKWYLEIDKDGNISIPFNSARMAPMASHYYYTMYLGAVPLDYSGGYTVGPDENGNMVETLYFPVEKVDDDTYVIKPYEATVEGVSQPVPCYPNAVVLDANLSSQPILTPKYVSELTLTRDKDGGTSAAAPSAVKAPAKVSAASKASSRKTRTTFENRPVYQKIDYILK